jgi:hypothetical protein
LSFLGVPRKSLAKTFFLLQHLYILLTVMTACHHLPLAPLGDLTSELTCFLLAPVSNSNGHLSTRHSSSQSSSAGKKSKKKNTIELNLSHF